MDRSILKTKQFDRQAEINICAHVIIRVRNISGARACTIARVPLRGLCLYYISLDGAGFQFVDFCSHEMLQMSATLGD